MLTNPSFPVMPLLVTVRVGWRAATHLLPDGSPAAGVEELHARVDPSAKVTVGEKITFAVNAAGMQFFDPDSGAAIWQ